MRQIRISRRHTRPASRQQTTLPLDARDPDIVHAHQITRHTSGSGPAANRPRRTPCIQKCCNSSPPSASA